MKKLYSNKLVILSLVLPGLLLFVFAILAPFASVSITDLQTTPEWVPTIISGWRIITD